MTAESIAELLPDHFEREVFEYFAEQIFASLPMGLQDFLVRSSILDPVEPVIARELTGRENAFETLATLARRNLFVHSAYDRERGWSFRYHQLFREFLLAKVRTQLSQEARNSLLLKAGSIYEQSARPEDAVKAYLQGKAYPQAVSVLQTVGLELLGEGRLAELAGWIEAIPSDMIESNSRLLFYRYMSRRLSHFHQNLPDLLRAYHLCRDANDAQGALLSLAALIEASVTKGGRIIPPIDRLMSEAEALAQSPEAAEQPYERAVLFLQMAFGYFLKLGDPRKGVWVSYNAYILAKDLADSTLQIRALNNLQLCYSALGEFKNAREVAQQVDRHLIQCPSAELRSLTLINSCQAHWFEGHLEQMDICLRKAVKTFEEAGVNYLFPVYLLRNLSYRRQSGQFAEAIEVGENLARLSLAVGNLWLRGNALLQTGLVYHFMGQTRKAQEFYLQAQDILSTAESRGDFHLNCTRVALALAAYRLQQNGDAKAQLARVINDWQEKGIHLFLKEAHLAMALLRWRSGEKPEAAKELKAAIGLMTERGFHVNLLLSREDLLAALILALELELEALWDYVFCRLTTGLADIAEAELDRLREHKNPRVAGKVWEIKAAIHRRQTPPLRIVSLGRFQVWRGESLMSETIWQGNQPKLMLKALIARGGQNVAKDVLIEDLWPETSAAAGDRNFRVILHRLRKALEPSLDKQFGSAYVHLKANRVSLDPELCSLDVERYATLCEQSRAMEREGDLRTALTTCEEAAKLYGGDFLVEEKYQPWAGSRRDELHRQHIALLSRLAGLYEQQGKIKKAIGAYSRILAADPLEEQACRRLMTLYADRGMRSEALKVYATCRRALERELGTTPDELTVSVYKSIADSSRQQKPSDLR